MDAAITYADAELGLHLGQLHISASTFAISWFLTLFSHTLSIPACVELYDVLLLHSDPALVVLFGLQIVLSKRDDLLRLEFDDVLFCLGNVAQLNVTLTIKEALVLRKMLPASLYHNPTALPMLCQSEYDFLCNNALIIDFGPAALHVPGSLVLKNVAKAGLGIVLLAKRYTCVILLRHALTAEFAAYLRKEKVNCVSSVSDTQKRTCSCTMVDSLYYTKCSSSVLGESLLQGHA